MARVTRKLQVTIPKAIADRYGIVPGRDIEWLPAGDAIRVVPHAETRAASDPARRLALFDRATERQASREMNMPDIASAERGWRREDVYERGGPR